VLQTTHQLSKDCYRTYQETCYDSTTNNISNFSNKENDHNNSITSSINSLSNPYLYRKHLLLLSAHKHNNKQLFSGYIFRTRLTISVLTTNNKSVLSLIPRLSTQRCPQLRHISIDSWYALLAAIDRNLPPVPKLQQDSGMSLLPLIDGTDRKTDGWTTDTVPLQRLHRRSMT